MPNSNYRLQWITSQGHPRESYFSELKQLRSFERKLQKDFSYQCTGSIWESGKWHKFVIVGNTLLTLEKVQTILKQLM